MYKVNEIIKSNAANPLFYVKAGKLINRVKLSGETIKGLARIVIGDDTLNYHNGYHIAIDYDYIDYELGTHSLVLFKENGKYFLLYTLSQGLTNDEYVTLFIL